MSLEELLVDREQECINLGRAFERLDQERLLESKRAEDQAAFRAGTPLDNDAEHDLAVKACLRLCSATSAWVNFNSFEMGFRAARGTLDAKFLGEEAAAESESDAAELANNERAQQLRSRTSRSSARSPSNTPQPASATATPSPGRASSTAPTAS